MSAQTPQAADDVVKLDNGLLVGVERWMGRTGMRLVPASMTANQVTAISGVFGLLAGACLALAAFDRLWFVAGALLLLLHWAGDNVDGHVARTRNQCSSSGRFLDIFADALTFTAVGLGFALSGHAHFEIVATATLFCLLQYVLTVLWIALARVWPFPAFGPAEALLSAIVIALLSLVLPRELLHVAGQAYSLIDVAFVLTIPGSVLTLIMSARGLYRHLQQQDAAG